MYEVIGITKGGDEFFIPSTDITAAISEVIRIQNHLANYDSYRLVQRNPMTQTIDDVVFEWSQA